MTIAIVKSRRSLVLSSRNDDLTAGSTGIPPVSQSPRASGSSPDISLSTAGTPQWEVTVCRHEVQRLGASIGLSISPGGEDAEIHS